MHKVKVAAEHAGLHNNGDSQAIYYKLSRNARTPNENRSDGANPEQPPSSNRSQKYTQSSDMFQQDLKSLDHKYSQKSSHRFEYHADIETKSHRRPSIHHDAKVSHRGPEQCPLYELPPEDPKEEPEMILQPKSRPISHEQLVAEVKGIYAGLVMVEAKCIDNDDSRSCQSNAADPTKRVNLEDNQWQSLIALYKQLLHEHHDFFLASQHPSASPALSRLATKYLMQARRWRHGIHAFLEVLRHRLPESLEHMLAFIHIAYSMMALLYETVSTFEDTWIECLGDLGRCRMAVEDDEPKDRKVWSNVARFWYNKAADKSPNVGRLYHHLAILARSYTLQQLSLYTRSLTGAIPFASTKEGIQTLFNPILRGKNNFHDRSLLSDIAFFKAHAATFQESLGSPVHFDATIDDLKVDKPFGQRVCNVTKLEHDLPKPTQELYGPLTAGSMVILGQLLWDIVTKRSIERMIHLADQNTSACLPSPTLEVLLTHRKAFWCSINTGYCSRIGQHAALVSNGLRRRWLSLNLSLSLPFLAFCLPVVRGSPIGNPDETNESSSIAPSLPLLVGSLYGGFAVAALAMANSLAKQKGPIRVWGCMMGISAYGWWVVRNDATASASLSITNLGVWAISAFQYGNATFQEFRIPERMSLITLLGALILDMAIVRLMTQSGAPISQSDLLSLSPPAMSLSLAITANLFGCLRNQPPSPPPCHGTEIGESESRGDSYIEGSFQQRIAVPDLETSRLHLLGSPLNEDPTRIWQNDD